MNDIAIQTIAATSVAGSVPLGEYSIAGLAIAALVAVTTKAIELVLNYKKERASPSMGTSDSPQLAEAIHELTAFLREDRVMQKQANRATEKMLDCINANILILMNEIRLHSSSVKDFMERHE